MQSQWCYLKIPTHQHVLPCLWTCLLHFLVFCASWLRGSYRIVFPAGGSISNNPCRNKNFLPGQEREEADGQGLELPGFTCRQNTPPPLGRHLPEFYSILPTGRSSPRKTNEIKGVGTASLSRINLFSQCKDEDELKQSVSICQKIKALFQAKPWYFPDSQYKKCALFTTEVKQLVRIPTGNKGAPILLILSIVHFSTQGHREPKLNLSFLQKSIKCSPHHCCYPVITTLS